jgi:hypothetical protein
MFNLGITLLHEFVNFSSGIKGEIETGLANTLGVNKLETLIRNP